MTDLAGAEPLVHWYIRHVSGDHRTLDDLFHAVDQLYACRHDHPRDQAPRKAKAAVATHSWGRP
jgi:hypothetical protein